MRVKRCKLLLKYQTQPALHLRARKQEDGGEVQKLIVLYLFKENPHPDKKARFLPEPFSKNKNIIIW